MLVRSILSQSMHMKELRRPQKLARLNERVRSLLRESICAPLHPPLRYKRGQDEEAILLPQQEQSLLNARAFGGSLL